MSRKQNTLKEKEEEFLELFGQFKKNLSRFCFAICANREDAKDLAAETIAIAFTKFADLKYPDAFCSFLFTIATRLNRKRKKTAARTQSLEDFDPEMWAMEGGNPEMTYDVSALYSALSAMPIKMSEAVILYEITGFSMEEIRKIQGGTLSGVKSRIKRGRASLSEMLAGKKYEQKMTKKEGIENG